MSVPGPAEHTSFSIPHMAQPDAYKLLASVILPRPIAWITSLDSDGVVNAAPFSFFNIVSSDPALVAVSFSSAPDRNEKDTLANIRATGDFVVNLVSEDLAQAMNITATNSPRGVDELELAGLAAAPSLDVKPPRIAASPVSLECVHFQTIEPGGASIIVLGRILRAHVITSAFEDLSRLHVDPHQLRLIGRMHGGGGYCTTRDIFTIPRLSWPLKQE